MSFRRRLEKSESLAAAIAWPLAVYLRLAFRTGRWQAEGLDELRTELARGPVIVVFWHGRLMLAGPAWPLRPARTVLPVAPSPAGLVSARTQGHFGSKAVVIGPGRGAMANIRTLLGAVREGNSLGLTADGPKGPARRAKSAPVEWAQATGRPVFLFSWSSPAAMRLNTWDRLMIPRPFSRGVYGYRKWKDAVPRKIGRDERLLLQQELTEALDDFDREMDRRTDLPPEN